MKKQWTDIYTFMYVLVFVALFVAYISLLFTLEVQASAADDPISEEPIMAALDDEMVIQNRIEFVDATEEDFRQQWKPLNDWAEEALSFVEKNEFADAKALVEEISHHFMELEMARFVEQPEQAHILMESIIQAKESLTAVELDEQEVQKKVLKMRLALNAVYHEERPLWMEYYEAIETILIELQHSLDEEQRDDFFQHLNRLSIHYELVRPSIVVSHRPGVYLQLDSQVTHVMDQRAELWQNKGQTEEMIQALLRQFRVAFFLEERHNESFWYLLFGLGTFISVVLGYVGWKKYKSTPQREVVSWREWERS